MKQLYFTLFLIFLFSFQSFSQSNCHRNQCNWEYISTTEKIKGIVLSNEISVGNCGGRAYASITIIKTHNDTLRILELCNLEDYSLGEEIFITPIKKPTFSVSIGSNYILPKIKNKQVSKEEKLPTRFDKTVLKSIWGEISKIN
ncbi:hypothetical protein [Aureispira sp. CCB-E]|uniref:hypothetical protein n=1 Tax=Aureispira sp. CCB-E TaxID=3051121 RepID=UPI002868529F|nr:hypothetical protein [Aureispira sp. CCB-E]WMX13141.1 hypothetical protein QP953_20065 [Aureispira sp. CCB-E]